MARYVFTYEVDGKTELYAESTPEEERLDRVYDESGEHYELATEFTGNGYLAFWKRCRQMVIDNVPLEARGHGTITDLAYGDEKQV